MFVLKNISDKDYDSHTLQIMDFVFQNPAHP